MKITYLFISLIIFLTSCSPRNSGGEESLSNQITWSAVTAPGYNPESNDYYYFNSGAWDGERFYLLTEEDKIYSSSDGVKWELFNVQLSDEFDFSPSLNDISSVNNTLLLRIDGYWNKLNENNIWEPILEYGSLLPIWNGKKYIAFSNNAFYTSTNLKDWSKTKTQENAFRFSSVVFDGKSYFSRVKDENITKISKDGISWSEFHPESNKINITSFKDNIYGSASNLPSVSIYKDTQWETVFRPKLGPSPEDKNLIVIDDQMFALGAHISWTENGVDWASINTDSYNDIETIVKGDDNYIAFGTEGLLMVGKINK